MNPWAYKMLIEALVDKIARGLAKRKGATAVGARNYLEKIGIGDVRIGDVTGTAFGRAGMRTRRSTPTLGPSSIFTTIDKKGAYQATNKARWVDDLRHPKNGGWRYSEFKDKAFRRNIQKGSPT